MDDAVAFKMGIMDGHGNVQTFLPADNRAMEIDCIPWDEGSGLSDIAKMRPECSLPIDDHASGGGVSP